MNDLTKSEKSKMRYDYLIIRDRLEPAIRFAYSSIIFSRIKKLEEYKSAKTIMFYLTYGSEVITDMMVNEVLADDKTVVVPIIKSPGDGVMQAMKISKLEDCYEKVYGIRQPEFNQDEVINKNDVDLVFVPGIVFDNKGYRIGYGKGYYDKWLVDIDVSKTIGLAYEVQLTDKLPIGQYDLPVGKLLTEKRCIEFTTN